jgi:ABC-2 type transport system ATP-binding protein
MIVAEDLTKVFDDFIAVNGVHLNVHAGQVLVLLGPNGAGKTTTVRMLTSILSPSRGLAIVNGYDVVKNPIQVRASVGVLTENHGLYNRMNALEYLKFYGKLYGLNDQSCNTRIESLLNNFGLTDSTDKRLGEFSKGMRQKLALSRALIHDPPVLLLDEPTSAMDPESANVVRNTIINMRTDERAIILCTHNLSEAEELADQIAIIRYGKILFNDTPENLKRRLLGPAEYEVHLTNMTDSLSALLPSGVKLSARGKSWLRFQIENPDQNNPKLLRSLIENNSDVISFQEIPRSLEQAYLEAVNRSIENELLS